jgi:hypothetical protein
VICIRDHRGYVTSPRSGVQHAIYSCAAEIDTAVPQMGAQSGAARRLPGALGGSMAVNRGRERHCANPHKPREFTAGNFDVRAYRNGGSRRYCRSCRTIYQSVRGGFGPQTTDLLNQALGRADPNPMQATTRRPLPWAAKFARRVNCPPWIHVMVDG